MAKYFGRRYRIRLLDYDNNLILEFDSSKEAHPLQIEFSIDTTFRAALSLMDISIFNLSAESIRKIFLASRIVFEAGYQDIFGTVFIGQVRNVVTTRDGVERKSTLYCWSGIEEQQSKICNISFSAKTPWWRIVNFVASDYFNKPPKLIGFGEEYKTKMGMSMGGYSFCSPHKVVLSNLAKDLGFQWLVENERVILMARGASNRGDTHLITPQTGLIGSVELTENGANFDMLLDPKIQIGDRVKVLSKSVSTPFSQIYDISLPVSKLSLVDGKFVVKALRRRGSFYSDSTWVSSLVCWQEKRRVERGEYDPFR